MFRLIILIFIVLITTFIATGLSIMSIIRNECISHKILIIFYCQCATVYLFFSLKAGLNYMFAGDIATIRLCILMGLLGYLSVAIRYLCTEEKLPSLLLSLFVFVLSFMFCLFASFYDYMDILHIVHPCLLVVLGLSDVNISSLRHILLMVDTPVSPTGNLTGGSGNDTGSSISGSDGGSDSDSSGSSTSSSNASESMGTDPAGAIVNSSGTNAANNSNTGNEESIVPIDQREVPWYINKLSELNRTLYNQYEDLARMNVKFERYYEKTNQYKEIGDIEGENKYRTLAKRKKSNIEQQSSSIFSNNSIRSLLTFEGDRKFPGSNLRQYHHDHEDKKVIDDITKTHVEHWKV